MSFETLIGAVLVLEIALNTSIKNTAVVADILVVGVNSFKVFDFQEHDVDYSLPCCTDGNSPTTFIVRSAWIQNWNKLRDEGWGVRAGLPDTLRVN